MGYERAKRRDQLLFADRQGRAGTRRQTKTLEGGRKQTEGAGAFSDGLWRLQWGGKGEQNAEDHTYTYYLRKQKEVKKGQGKRPGANKESFIPRKQ